VQFQAVSWFGSRGRRHHAQDWPRSSRLPGFGRWAAHISAAVSPHIFEGFVCDQASRRGVVFHLAVPGSGVEFDRLCPECVDLGRREPKNGLPDCMVVAGTSPGVECQRDARQASATSLPLVARCFCLLSSSACFRHRPETEHNLASDIVGDDRQKCQVPATGAVLPGDAECIPFRVVGVGRSLVLIKDAFGRIFEELVLTEIEDALKVRGERRKGLPGLAGNHHQRRRCVVEHSRTVALAIEGPIGRNGDLAGVLGVFDDLPVAWRHLCAKRQIQENQNCKYVFSHNPSVTPGAPGRPN